MENETTGNEKEEETSRPKRSANEENEEKTSSKKLCDRSPHEEANVNSNDRNSGKDESSDEDDESEISSDEDRNSDSETESSGIDSEKEESIDGVNPSIKEFIRRVRKNSTFANEDLNLDLRKSSSWCRHKDYECVLDGNGMIYRTHDREHGVNPSWVFTPSLETNFLLGALDDDHDYKPLNDFKDEDQAVVQAIMKEDVETVKKSMEYPLDNTKRRNGCSCTLLQMLANKKLPKMVELLLDFVDINAVNRYNQTAAHLAALEDNTEMLKILLANKDFNPDVEDIWSNTYRDMLSIPLFTSIWRSDIDHIKELLALGANPDFHAGQLIQDISIRELGVQTPRELASSLNNNSIIQSFVEHDSLQSLKGAGKIQRTSPSEFQIPKCFRPGFVAVFSYESFQEHSDLYNSTALKDAASLGSTFHKRDYNGEVYTSLTAEDTIQALKDFREMEMMKDVSVLIFYFISYTVHEEDTEESFLTSDMKFLRVNSVLNLFKTSQCPPYLKDVPKLFIFDLRKRPDVSDNRHEYPNGMNNENHENNPTGRRAKTICWYSSYINSRRPTSYGSPVLSEFCYAISEEDAYGISVQSAYADVIEDLKSYKDLSIKSYCKGNVGL